ncbi:MAG: hypothetical protein U5K54_00045 [Cytophagales bacterium]|nr:hypothetical protein [Cytophagales bacterium]
MMNQVVFGVVRSEMGYVFFYNSGKIEFFDSFGVTDTYPDLARHLAGQYVNHVTQISDSRISYIHAACRLVYL